MPDHRLGLFPSRLTSVLLLPAPFLLMGIQQCQTDDSDGDDWTVEQGDCDDQDPNTYPGALELCDAKDNDCDGISDGGIPGAEPTCAAGSCLELLEAGQVADGTYWLDTGAGAFEAWCDMTTDGGGWTRAFADDFETAPNGGWSISSTYTCGDWTTMLGGYLNIAGGEMSNQIGLLGVPHTSARVELDYIKLDSWDGELAYLNLDGVTAWSANLVYYEGSEAVSYTHLTLPTNREV